MDNNNFETELNELNVPGDIVDVESWPGEGGEGGVHDGQRGAVLGRELHGHRGADVVQTLQNGSWLSKFSFILQANLSDDATRIPNPYDALSKAR